MNLHPIYMHILVFVPKKFVGIQFTNRWILDNSRNLDTSNPYNSTCSIFILTFFSHLQYHISGVYVNDHQGSQCGSRLFGQLATHQDDNVTQLLLEFLPVILQSPGTAADCLMHFLSPVNLGHTQYDLSWPLPDPINTGLNSIGLQKRNNIAFSIYQWKTYSYLRLYQIKNIAFLNISMEKVHIISSQSLSIQEISSFIHIQQHKVSCQYIYCDSSC